VSSEGQEELVDSIIGGVFEGVDSWDAFAASLFWVFVVCGGVSFVHIAIVWVGADE